MIIKKLPVTNWLYQFWRNMCEIMNLYSLQYCFLFINIIIFNILYILILMCYIPLTARYYFTTGRPCFIVLSWSCSTNTMFLWNWRFVAILPRTSLPVPCSNCVFSLSISVSYFANSHAVANISITIVFVMGIWDEWVNFDATVVKGLQLTEGWDDV